MKHKSEVYHVFLAFQKLVENLFDHKIKFVRSDGGKEFANDSLKTHFIRHDIYFLKILAPHS